MFLPNPDDYYNLNMDDQVELDVINLLDESDPIKSWIQNVEIDPQFTYVVAHGNNSCMATKVYVNGEIIPGDIFSAEDIANILFDYGWNGEIVYLFACNTARDGVLSFAQEVADLLNGFVVAPIQTLHVFPNGFYYVSDETIHNRNDYHLYPDYQKSMWQERGVIVY